ncbi:serine hydrolase domain-containing protein [Curtobacterium sp. 'Ferrero']|uniref:serine hydrolase domain-containing protein n=1 Tax=Curtobacterium sp. 'Ferrero' TaxID=2033654 RepID=UPI001596A83E|nr:serine hydrolase domain-containing protein [Curtobacterium sp. 'Ferrero']
MTVDDDVLARVDRVFAERVANGVAPSSVWGVFDRDGLVASGGHGDRGDGRAPDADTVYRIASCTKSVTAATLLTLVADGRLDLDAPVTDFVPAFDAVRLPTPDSPVPTLRMLLTMSAGFPTDDPWADRQESTTDADLDAVLTAGLLFDSVPGTGFAYSNLGYALLGRVVSVVTGRPYTEAATTAVLRPLGLDATVFAADRSDGFVVVGTRPDGTGWEQLPLSGPGAFSAIGGLFSTVTDLARWGRHLASAFSETPEPGPLSPADRRAMQQALRVVPPSVLPGATRATAYGLGLFVEQDERSGPIASHSGGYPGFSAHMRWSTRDGLGVVAFENATQAKVATAATTALDLVLSAHGSSTDAPRVAPETRAAQGRVTELLRHWDDATADAVCTPNVALDEPYERRRQAIAEAAAAIGADLGAEPVAEESLTPTHLRWWLPGTSGRLRVEIRLAPLAAGLVQTLIVRSEPSEQ